MNCLHLNVLRCLDSWSAAQRSANSLYCKPPFRHLLPSVLWCSPSHLSTMCYTQLMRQTRKEPPELWLFPIIVTVAASVPKGVGMCSNLVGSTFEISWKHSKHQNYVGLFKIKRYLSIMVFEAVWAMAMLFLRNHWCQIYRGWLPLGAHHSPSSVKTDCLHIIMASLAPSVWERDIMSL